MDSSSDLPAYAELLNKLLAVNLHSGMKLGLRNSIALDLLSGRPSEACEAIHVAGTNGKGSVSTKIAAGLQADGRRTGLYTSPHLSCFRERIRINGQMISEGHLQGWMAHFFALIERAQIRATFFELATAIAFAHFAEQQVQVSVIEAGLGGRLDATNILKPRLSIITSISLEHTEILGATIEAITREKCGIIKPQVPVIIGPRVPKQIVEEYARTYCCPLIQVEGEFSDYHAENQAIARAAMQQLALSAAAMEAGAAAVPACRLQIFTREHLTGSAVPEAVILDVAHNPDGFAQLLKALNQRFPARKLRFLLGMSKNKEIKGCCQLLKEAAQQFHLVEAPNARAASAAALKTIFLEVGVPGDQLHCEQSIEAGLQRAMQRSAAHGELLIVCGTFFIMAAVRRALGLQEPVDPVDMNEQSLNRALFSFSGRISARKGKQGP